MNLLPGQHPFGARENLPIGEAKVVRTTSLKSSLGTRTRTEHFLDGRLHRPPGEGPAAFDTNNGLDKYEEFWFEGLRAASPVDGAHARKYDRFGGLLERIFVKNPEAPEETQVRVVERVLASGLLSRVSHYVGNTLSRDPKVGPASTLYNDDGSVHTVEYKLNGVFHRDPEDGAAVTSFFEDGRVRSESYMVNGELHRPQEHGPARRTWWDGGGLHTEEYIEHGKRNRNPDHGPSKEEWGMSGELFCREYCSGDVLHRPSTEGPAKEEFRDHTCITRIFSEYGKFHRPTEEGPAVKLVTYNPRGKSKKYCVGGTLHRPWWEGAAVICQDVYRRVTFYQFFFNGEEHRPFGDGSSSAKIQYGEDGDPIAKRVEAHFVKYGWFRNALQGPAVSVTVRGTDPDGSKMTEWYYQDQKAISDPDSEDWAHDHAALRLNFPPVPFGPRYIQYSPEGEMIDAGFDHESRYYDGGTICTVSRPSKEVLEYVRSRRALLLFLSREVLQGTYFPKDVTEVIEDMVYPWLKPSLALY